MQRVDLIVNELIRQVGDIRLIAVADDRVTIEEAANMCGMALTTFNETIRKEYGEEMGESKAFRRVTFSRHKVLRTIWKHQKTWESQYKTQ